MSRYVVDIMQYKSLLNPKNAHVRSNACTIDDHSSQCASNLRPPTRVSPHQSVDVHAHAPRVHIDVQTPVPHQRDAVHDAFIAIRPRMVLVAVLETSAGQTQWPAADGWLAVVVATTGA